MFNFISELTDLEKINDYRYINFGGKKCYVQGFSSLLTFSEENIILKLKNGELNIEGCNLKIEELGKDTILVSGKIIEVKFDEV